MLSFEKCVQELCIATKKEWTNIPQVTIKNLINTVQRKCVEVHTTNGGNTRYWQVLCSWPFVVTHPWHTCAGGWIILAKVKDEGFFAHRNSSFTLVH